MAESFVFNIAEKVLVKLGSLALREVCLACCLVSEKQQLQNTISAIQAVLLDAEERQANNHQLADWLGKIKYALYDADDVLDEFQYEDLRSQVVNREGIKRKVCNFFSSSNPIAFRFKMGHKIKGIREKLYVIAAEKAKFNLTERLEDKRVAHDREMTHSFVRPSDVIGRDADKENIIQLLMSHGDGENVSVIPIVGIGGLGKTTLAKLVYNDERVVKHFELKMWVCVSEDFDVIKLTKEIIKSAEIGENCNNLTIDQLQSCLRRTLANKKFLLVLDDVWNQDRGEWVKLRDLLLDGANGSKIVVTTGIQLVASIMCTIRPYHLKGLPHHHCFSLFIKWAFNEGEEKHHPNLLKIGDEIVKKCRGVPLAAKTLAGLLYLRTDERDWFFIKDNEIWKLEQKKDDILPALRLSYDEMPSYLKQCFVYCSIFPKDYKFDNYELIEYWMAQGLLHSSNKNRELEDIGFQYLKELWSKCFFQDVEDHGTALTFKIHDLVHDLALSVAQTECHSSNFHTLNISKSVRHVSFSGDEDTSWEEVPRFLLKQENVRTILFPENSVGPTSEPFAKTCISRFNYLRVLNLTGSHLETVPHSIGDLKHLRYLNLSKSIMIKKLPNSIRKLQGLQTLRLQECRELEELPKGIGNLISLRSLYVTVKQLILAKEGIESLRSLRYLQIEECHNLKSLGEGVQHLTDLRTLVVVICESLEGSLPRILKNLTALETLGIADCEKLNFMEQEEDIQGLSLNLRSVLIGKLPQLVALPKWLQGAANTLQSIIIGHCDNLVALPEWLQNLTLLQKLEIINCPKLLALPEGMHRLIALQKLKIEGCPKLSNRCRRDIGEDWPKITHVPDITVDGENMKSIYN